jgi:glutamate decarboxylase
MMAHLLNAPEDCNPVGTATIGSSEAIMLGLLAHKWSWRLRRKDEGKSTDRPNIVIGADVHTCWEKFALYFDVENKIVPMTEEQYILTAKDVASRIDENTIAVGVVLGTTFTGQVDEIEKINNLLLKVKEEKGWNIQIHVDGASGGFIAPFAYPDLKWDFRLLQVKSINISNHNFGLSYPGMGTLIFRDKSILPEELVFHINYLGGEMPNYSLNFSRGSATIILQYYNFLRLGRSGYRRIMKNILENAHYLGKCLLDTGKFHLLSDSKFLPVVVAKLKDGIDLNIFELSGRLRMRGWIIPAYTLPPNAQNITVLRMVIKENFSRDMVEMLAEDIKNAILWLEKFKIKTEKEIKEKRAHHLC